MIDCTTSIGKSHTKMTFFHKIPGLGVVEKTAIVGSNVLYFELIDGSALVVRPSGTEPKIKMYVLARDDSAEGAEEKAARFADFARGLSK